MKLQFVAHCRLWWKRWSTWLAGLFALIVGYFTAYPGQLIGLVAYVPEQWRPIASVAVSFTVFVVPVIINNLRQTKLMEARNDLGK